MTSLDRVRELGASESGLAVAITTRADGSPRASVVNAGVLDVATVAFVSRGTARKLVDLRARQTATVVFRSGWDWAAVEGATTLLGPDDNPDAVAPAAILELVRRVYAAAVGGTPDDWSQLDASMEEERHTAVLVHVERVYPRA